MEAIEFFQWVEGSALAAFTKSHGGLFAAVQTVHLASMALLGGMVLLLNLRLLGVLLTELPVAAVVAQTRRWIGAGLAVVMLSGSYMASAVAMKLYYNDFFWAKMTGLALGVAFLYAVQFPLLRDGEDGLLHWTPRVVAAASLMLWFSVAASGRWIGFS
jgi:hypothetical protein